MIEEDDDYSRITEEEKSLKHCDQTLQTKEYMSKSINEEVKS